MIDLQHALLLPAGGQVDVVSVDPVPLGVRVVVQVQVLGRVLLEPGFALLSRGNISQGELLIFS